MKNLSPSLYKLLTILNDGEFHSGTELGMELAMTRSAIWKLIKQLTDYDVDIESVHNKGYRLSQPIIPLNRDSILDYAQPPIPLHPHLELFASIPSTQDYLKPLATSCDKPLICFAEHQTQGRGRLARKWHSPFGLNLFFSCLLPIQKELSELGGLSLIVGLAIIRALEQYGLQPALELKWPNDIYCQDKKLGGILIEVMGETNGSAQILIGIGLNINMREAGSTDIAQNWTSLYRLTQNYHDRNKIAGYVIHWLFDYLNEFEQHGLRQFLPLWKKYDYLAGREINVINGTKTQTGQAIGINQYGHLQVMINGEIITCMAGDTSVRKTDSP